MLLAYLGFGGERTNIGGHVAGFAAGTLLGGGAAWAGNRVPQAPGVQRWYGAAAAALFILAWLLALRAQA